MGVCVSQHCNGAKYAREYLNYYIAPPSGSSFTSNVSKNRFMMNLPSGYQLSVISPLDATGNRAHEIEGLMVAPIIETALFHNGLITYNYEWGYHDVRRFLIKYLDELATEYIKLHKLIAPNVPAPSIREIPDEFYPPTEEGFREFLEETC